MPFSQQFTKYATLTTIAVLSFLPTMAGAVAEAKDYGLGATATKAYGKLPSVNNPRDILADLLGVVLSALGIIFLVQIVIAGIKWLTAQGEEEKITAAKQQIIHSIIGLVIVVSAYAIVKFVLVQTLLPVVGIESAP